MSLPYTNMKEEEIDIPNSHPQTPDYAWKPDDQPMTTPTGDSNSGRSPIIDPEDLTAKNFIFSDKSIRRGFIRKVYLILMAQLIVTFGVVAVFIFCEPVQQFAENNSGLVSLSAIFTLILVISMACCDTARRTFPLNMICLGLFTIAESFLVGTVSAQFDTDIVIIAFGITALLCLALSIFAMQTKYDFTVLGGSLLICLIVLMIFGIVGIFWRNYILDTVYAGCGAILACVYLIYDTQTMMGGEHKYSISPEEYVFAALNLYLDVIRIFLFILRLLGMRRF